MSNDETIKTGSIDEEDGHSEQNEKLILSLSIFLIIFIASVQVIILTFGTDLRNADIELQGVVLENTEYLYDYGYITIQLVEMESCPGLDVLKNGSYETGFISKSIRLEVVKGDIIEIDASRVTEKVAVKVVNVSGSVSCDCRDVFLAAKGGIKQLLKVN